MDYFLLYLSCVCHVFASDHCCLVVTCWEKADIFALVCDVKFSFCHFLICYPVSGVILDCIDSWPLPPFYSNNMLKYNPFKINKLSAPFDTLLLESLFTFLIIYNDNCFVGKVLTLSHLYMKRISTSLHFCRLINNIFIYSFCSH